MTGNGTYQLLPNSPKWESGWDGRYQTVYLPVTILGTGKISWSIWPTEKAGRAAGRDSQIFACQLARSKSAESAALCPSDMMLCVISYWVLSGAKRRQIQQLRCCVLPTKLLKRRDVYLKLTRHNGRAGAHGTYNPKHNDRSFNLANSEHIDPERAKGNIYWDCFHGFRSALDPQDPDDLATTFSDVERQFYETHYTAFIENQNERNAKIRHTERNHSIPDLLSSRKTCPEETIYQLGTLDEHASAEDLLSVVTEFIEEFKAKYGDHVHVLDWALHLDESTPHIHERHVFDCENKYGEIAPQQEKALEALGFELPDPAKPLSRRNNRKITFDAACRKMLFEIAKRHGLELEEEAEYGNRKYLEKQDFILAKQKEQLAAQQNKLDELTLKVSDMETLLEDVSAAAYDKAVEVVTDVVRTETRKEDMRMIEDTKKWVLSPERKAPQATREYAAHRRSSCRSHEARLDGICRCDFHGCRSGCCHLVLSWGEWNDSGDGFVSQKLVRIIRPFGRLGSSRIGT